MTDISTSYQEELGRLSPLAPDIAKALTCVSSDLALVLDEAGIIQSASAGGAVGDDSVESWLGKPWAETVPHGMRGKVQAVLEEVRGAGLARAREIAYVGPSGTETLLACSAVRLGRTGPILVAGRNLQAIAAIQQRLLRSQQEMEHEYWVPGARQ